MRKKIKLVLKVKLVRFIEEKINEVKKKYFFYATNYFSNLDLKKITRKKYLPEKKSPLKKTFNLTEKNKFFKICRATQNLQKIVFFFQEFFFQEKYF